MLSDRSYFRELIQHLLFVLMGVIFLVALGAVVRASATSQGAPIWVPLTLVPLMVGNALPYFFPMALLVSIVLTYGRMAADGEYVALLAAGRRPVRLIAPAFLAAFILAIAAYMLTSTTVPHIYGKMRDIMRRVDLAALENTNPSSSGMHFRGLDLSWRSRDLDGSFRDVVLFMRPPAEGSTTKETNLRVRAERASMDFQNGELIFALDGMRSWSDHADDGGGSWTCTAPNRTYLRVDVATLGDRMPPSAMFKHRSSSDLLAILETDDSLQGARRNEYRFVVWERFTQALSFIPIVWIGAFLGWSLRRAGYLSGFAAGLAVLMSLYYPLYFLGRGLAKENQLDAIPAAFLPLFGLLLFGAFLWKKRFTA